jgi:hypothetical protein
MPEPWVPDPESEDLILRRFDERLTEAEFAAFDERLRSDAAFRQHYVRMADLNACLYDELSEVPMRLTAAEAKNRTAWTSRTIIWSCLAATVVAILAAIWPSGIQTDVVPDTTAVNSTPSPNAAPLVADEAGTRFLADESANAQDAAVLVMTDGQTPGPLVAGFRFRPGMLKLDRGYMQIEFISGAVVGLTGPAEFRIESSSAATIFSGQAAANVPERARGFVLNTPSAAVVDLGTEFAVEIDSSGNTEVEVISGEVELSLLGDDGSTLLSERVNDSRVVRVDRDELKLTEMGRESEPMSQLRAIPETPLTVSDKYVQSVLDCRPLIYWRFEQSDQNRIRNEVSEQWPAIVYAAESEPEGLRIAEGCARFRRTNASRFFRTDESLPNLNAGDYSIELWIRPDDLSHSTCLGIFPESEPDARTHLNVIEIATETFLIHEPGAIRFLHRNPPEQQWKLGTNAFSKGICTPHQWQHIVAVKQSASMALYYNGQLARRVDLSDANGPGPYRLLAGQLNPASNWRQYSGAMDEVALYPMSLTEEQIALHYRLVVEK